MKSSEHIANQFNDPASISAAFSSFTSGATAGAVGTAGTGVAGTVASAAGALATSSLATGLLTSGQKAPTPVTAVTREVAASTSGSRQRKGLASTILADSGNSGNQGGGNTLLGGG